MRKQPSFRIFYRKTMIDAPRRLTDFIKMQAALQLKPLNQLTAGFDQRREILLSAATLVCFLLGLFFLGVDELREGGFQSVVAIAWVMVGGVVSFLVYSTAKRNQELTKSLQKATESLNDANAQLQFYNESLSETVKKRTEELLFAELQYRSLFDSTAELIFICSADYRVLEVNRAVELFFGWDRNSLQEFNLMQRLAPDDTNRMILAAQQTEKGELVKTELVLKDQRGEPHFFQAEFSPLTFGQSTVSGGFKILLQDITIEKQTRLESEVIIKIGESINRSNSVNEILQRVANELGGLFPSAEMILYQYDDDENTLFLAHASILGVERADLIYRVAEGVPGIAPRTAFLRREFFIEDCLLDESLAYAELFLRQKAAQSLLSIPMIASGDLQGVLQILTLRGKHFSNDEKRLARLIANELAEGLYRKKLSAALTEANKTLGEKNAELEHFVYSVSHDLKAPLISIQGFAAQIQELYFDELDYEARFCLERIRYNAKTMEDMISELLDISRISRENVELDEVYLYEMTSSIMENYRGHIETRKAKVDISPELPAVKFPKRRLEQVMTNLVGNAIRYTAKVKEPKISIYAIENIDNHEIVVKDNGIGIDPKDFDKVFRLFERGESDQAGSGVGLAIVKKVIEQYGGRIWIVSERGAGSEFHFTVKKRA